MSFYYCTRQRAGPLIKESRALRPRLSKTDAAWERREKQSIIKSCRSAVCRSPADRLELRLALFGYDGTFYTLTFSPEFLPADFSGVRRTLRAFLSRTRRWRDGRPFDYAYAIEGLHARWHIHMILRTSDFSPTEIRHLWKYGIVDDEPLLRREGGFRRIGEYLNKERGGTKDIPLGRHPWSVSRSLSRRLPPPDRWRDPSGAIQIPSGCLWARQSHVANDFGEYHYASYILPPHASVLWPRS